MRFVKLQFSEERSLVHHRICALRLWEVCSAVQMMWSAPRSVPWRVQQNYSSLGLASGKELVPNLRLLSFWNSHRHELKSIAHKSQQNQWTKASRMDSTTEKPFCRKQKTMPAGQTYKLMLFQRFCSLLLFKFLCHVQVCWGGRFLRCWLERYRLLYFYCALTSSEFIYLLCCFSNLSCQIGLTYA